MGVRRLYFSVFGSFLIQLILGTAYISGNISVYLASYLRIYDPSVTLSQVNSILPLQLSMSTIFVAVGTKVYLKLGARLTTALGNGLLVAAVFCTSFVDSLVGYLLLYGMLYGIGVGMSVNAS